MHAYLATICRDLAAEHVRIGGVAGHVDIVATLPRTEIDEGSDTPRFEPDIVGRLTYSLPLARPAARPSMSLASLRLYSVRHRFIARTLRTRQADPSVAQAPRRRSEVSR
jgi:hypothetical protein